MDHKFHVYVANLINTKKNKINELKKEIEIMEHYFRDRNMIIPTVEHEMFTNKDTDPPEELHDNLYDNLVKSMLSNTYESKIDTLINESVNPFEAIHEDMHQCLIAGRKFIS